MASKRTATKPLLKSKTVWANLIVALAVAFIPKLREAVSTNPELSALLIAGLNSALRVFTKKATRLF